MACWSRRRPLGGSVRVRGRGGLAGTHSPCRPRWLHELVRSARWRQGGESGRARGAPRRARRCTRWRRLLGAPHTRPHSTAPDDQAHARRVHAAVCSGEVVERQRFWSADVVGCGVPAAGGAYARLQVQQPAARALSSATAARRLPVLVHRRQPSTPEWKGTVAGVAQHTAPRTVSWHYTRSSRVMQGMLPSASTLPRRTDYVTRDATRTAVSPPAPSSTG